MGRRVLLLLALGGCSVEGARQAGDTCLNDRECASPLRCELTAAGAMRCVAPRAVDAAAADLPALPDAVDAPPATDVVDAPAAPDADDAGARD